MRLTTPPISRSDYLVKETAKFLLLSVGVIKSMITTAMADPITLYYENRPPFTYVQANQLMGAEGKPAADAFKATGVDFILSEAPGAREINLIEKNLEPACAVGLHRLAEREKLGKFSVPLYFKQSKGLIVRSDNRKINSYTTWSEMLANPLVSIVVRNGYSYGEKLDSILAHAKARVKRPAAESHERIRLILEGTTDGAVFTPIEAEYQIKQFGEEGRALRVMHFTDSPPPEPAYLYCSNSVDDKILTKVDEYLKKLNIN